MFSLTRSTASLPELHSAPSGAALLSGLPSQGEPAPAAALGGDLLQRWQQALLRQVGLQGVEDVELLVHTEGQELLDHLAGVWAPERRREKIIKHTSSKMNSLNHQSRLRKHNKACKEQTNNSKSFRAATVS